MANEKYAQMALQALKRNLEEHPDSTPIILTHDFELTLTANSIRRLADEENLRCKIGFYFHSPFPTWDFIKICPWFDSILQGILGADLIGFQTENYCLNFIDSCEFGLKCRVDRKSLLAEHGNRAVRIRSLPLGVQFER